MGVWVGGGGVGGGGGGRGHFHPAAIYCTTTWCFALKGLCTINKTELAHVIVFAPGSEGPKHKRIRSAAPPLGPSNLRLQVR